ncbi:G5 domain-containing protein [Corynebacterium urinipleomorphum]|uniref:G5 domain-containing protein n=1 Tax=Corynebacterium urinipleomorphum TaxID=1852380 RepID=UPI000B363648|nr:G5 domain-containing protein [Corynebacterium urinipleomorphum]
MTKSNRSVRRSSRTGIAGLSVIALALGGLSVVGPGPAATQATAATMTGGLRGKSGAVEKDAQKASDLPAGSCVVDDNSQSGSQAGFSWQSLEPGPRTLVQKQKDWGVSLAFDNSQDRTFADWSFANSGNHGNLLNTGSVSSMDAGTTFPVEPPLEVTAKADENITITAAREQRNLTLWAELTEDEVKQFAEAGADNPVRYAWMGKYTKENPNGLKATQGDNAAFRAVVNPWPSENIECNPITVSWEDFEKHVIVAGDETKVGHINIPALTGGGTDDSISRMVVEAYDGNGKFIGTTDPAVSGGEQNLRVDDNGDIYFTWPEYRGTDLATDKNVNFSVLAQPRSVGQLQAAAEHNNSGEGKAFDSSNSLERYSKANVIDSKAFSLDDTEYHDPKYGKTSATIISGVDSATGPLATEPQKVTFTQVPDLIADLKKKKDQGGFEAKVKLDKKYVYAGWSVEMDKETHEVTVTAPENPEPGTFALPKVVVEYSNGSTDVLELLVVVDPNNTQVTDLVRPGLTKGKVNEDMTSQIALEPILEGHDTVHPANYEVDPATVPAGWTVTVDKTGKVTAVADESVEPGTVITPKVTATYPDGTKDEVEVQFQAIVDIKIPDYDTVTNKPNQDVSMKPEVPERGLSGNTTDEPPKRYTFEDGTTTFTLTDDSGTWNVKINETTGEITTRIPKTAPEGYVLNLPVLAHYDENKPQKVKATVVVIKGDLAPVYPVETTGPNQAVEHQVEDAPKGSTFSFGKNGDQPILKQEVDGWKYTIDPDTGVVSSTPPADAKPGDKNTVLARVETQDGLVAQVPVTTVVKLTNSWEAEPSYPVETVFPGDTAELSVELQKPDNVSLAADNPYELGAVPPGWDVSIDKEGRITATAPADAKPGSKVEIPVTVTYADGSKDTTKAVVNVVDVPTRPVPFKVEYVYDDTIPAGEYKTVTKGVAGEEKQNRDGTWEQTTAPTNEVVHIGTKPAEASKDVTWKVPVPYSTTTRPNLALAPGEQKVVQKGVNGERTYTAKFTATGDQASVVESEDTKQPVEEIIEYGPRLDDQELVTETTRKIPFETTIVFDNTLKEGEQVVDTQGVVGEEKVTSTQKLVDGKPSGDPVVTTTTVTEKQDAVIRVGSKTEGANTVEHTEPVPYETKVEIDPNMPAGTYEVVTPGKAGEKTVKVTQTIVNSEVTETKRDEKVTVEPVTEVIKVGTKQATATDTVEWTEPIPFSTVVRPNPDLKPGEVKTVQDGKNGEAKYTATFTGTNGEAAVKEETSRTEPTDQIIEYGPTIADQTLTSTTTNPVPFNTTFVADPTLPVGEQVVDKQGENGVDTVTATQEIKDGKPVGEPTITTERTKEPVDAVVRVGTKTTGETVNSYEAEIPFPTRFVYDPSLAPGESKVTQVGKPGTKKVTVNQPVVNSQPNGEASVTEETVTEPVEHVVTIGTKPDSAFAAVAWTAPIPFDTVIRPNPDLKPGEVKTVQQGEYGEKKVSANFTATGGNSTAGTTEEVTKQPKDQVIEYGPTIADQILKSETTRTIEFETEIIFDDTLPAGQQVVDQQGENGEEKITSTQEIKDGKPVGEPKISTEVTKAPKKAIIRVGTNPITTTSTATEQVPTTVTQTTEVPTTVTETTEVTTTVDGTPTTITETKEIPTTVSTTIIETKEVPTTVPTTVKETETTTVKAVPDSGSEKVKLPFTTRIVFDPNLEPGQEVEDVKGVDGEVTVTFTDGKVSAQTTKEPVQRVVRVGSKPAEGAEWTEETPYGVKVEEDPTIEAGKYVIAQEGKPGQIVHHADGTETKTQATDYIIKVGTKATGKNTETVEAEIPFDVEVVYDPNLRPGESKVTQEGKPGKKKVTIVRDIVNSQPGEPTITEEVIEQPVKKIVTVGTKPAQASHKVEWVAPLPYDTIVRPNPDLKPGEIKVVQEGEFGEKKFTADFTATDGNAAASTKEEITKEPKKQIIEYGPTIADQTLKTVESHLLPYETEFVLDDTLPAGTQKVEQQGQNGLETITSTQEFKDGKPVGEPKITRDTQDPKKAIIRVGTKPVTTTATTTEITASPTTVEKPVPTTVGTTETITTTVNGEPTILTTTKEVPTTVTEKSTERTTETVTVPITTVIENHHYHTTTVTPSPETKVLTTTVIPSPVTTTVTEQGEPVTTTITPDPKTTVVTTTLTGEPVTTTVTEKADPVTTTVEVPVKEVEVKVVGGTIIAKGKPDIPLALALRDPLVKNDTLKFRPVNGGTLSDDGRTLTVEDQGVWKVNPETGEVSFTPKKGFVGQVTPVELDYERTDGAEVIKPIRIEASYPKAEEPSKPGKPGKPDTDEPTIVPPAEDGSSVKAKQTAERCFGNAVRSPILWLLPIGILGAVGGKVLEPHMAAINQQFGEFNAEINRRVQQSMPDFGFGGHHQNNEQINQLMAQVDAANRQLQALAGDPNVQMIGKVIGAVAALAAISGVLYDWCSAEVGQAKTAIDFGEGSSSRR